MFLFLAAPAPEPIVAGWTMTEEETTMKVCPTEDNDAQTTDAATKIQSTFRGAQGRKAAANEKWSQIKEHEMHIEFQTIWQMLLMGFEIIKFPTKGRPRKRICWLTLDGKLCIAQAKSDKFTGKFIHLKYVGWFGC